MKSIVSLTPLCAALLATPALLAQTAPDADSGGRPYVLSPYVVQSTKDSAYRVENAVATTGIAQPIVKTPLPIDVITQQFLKDIGQEGFLGAMRYESGITLDPDAADGNGGGGQLLPGFIGIGSSPANLTRFRGQPYSGTYRNGLRMEYGFSTDNVDRIEVAKGPMAVFVGGATLGGEVNLVTEKPSFTPFREAFLKADNHGSFEFGEDATGPVSSTLAYRVITSYNTTQTWRDFSHSQTKYADPQFLWAPFKRLTMRVEGEYRYASGNLVSQSVSRTQNYQDAYNSPPQALLNLGKLRTTGPEAGQPYTVDEYRLRIGQSFGAWRQDVFDTTGQWVSLNEGSSLFPLLEGTAPDGRRYNYYGPNAHFGNLVTLLENENILVANDWLTLRTIGRYSHSYQTQAYYWYAPRIWAGGNTHLVSGDSARVRDDEYAGKAEAVFTKRLGWFDNTLLLGLEGEREENEFTYGAWNYSALAPVAASPNVFGSPNPLTGQDVFNYFDPATQSFPDTNLVQRYADDVAPAGVGSRYYHKYDPVAKYLAGSVGLWDDRVLFTGGYRRETDYTVSATKDRNDGIVTDSSGALQSTATPRIGLSSWMAGVVVEPVKGFNLYASRNYGETYQPGSEVGLYGNASGVTVSQQEMAAHPLPDATGTGTEAGIKVDLFRNTLTGSFGWFDLLRGGIPAVDAGRTSLDPRNVGTNADPNPATANPNVQYKVQWLTTVNGNESTGFETDWLWTPIPEYSLMIGGSHLYKNRITVTRPLSNDPHVLLNYLLLNGRPLEASPDNTFRMYQRYEFAKGGLKGFSVGLGVRAASSMQPNANSSSWGTVYPGFWEADVNFGYKTTIRGLKTSFLLGITNATNRTYTEGGNLFAPPREYALTTRVDF